MSLHPDKIVSLSNIANGASPTEREPAQSSTMEQRAINASKTRKLLAMPKDPGAIGDLAYAVRDTHWANHLSRLKARVSKASPEQTTKPATPTVVFQLPGPVNNG